MKDELGIDTTLPHYEVRRFLATSEPGAEFDTKFEKLVGLEFRLKSYSTSIDDIVTTLMKNGHWWHLSHLEATVILTKASGSGPWTNATRHDSDGIPYRYSQIHDGKNIAYSLCAAWIKAVYDLPTAYYIVSTMAEEKKANSWMKDFTR